ncbi:lytic transglycosylase domain-containing protein [Chitinimonas sp. BJYL2]|uniref:lytic transglycosylase domain-containing protein n=1 Tax=Chitinimonas sp. BJYL2 TaxID=2976696 RepID=UPI0022B4599A|nr:lytic transglycosylase domain-containing protein [Chitinimonas sp. BJYL2]
MPMRHCLPYLLLLLSTLTAQAALVDDMNAAREAARTGKLEQIVAITERTDGTALEMYPRYWLLNAQIELLPEPDVMDFLDRYRGSPLADRLRGDWLKRLGKRGDWALFEREWPKLLQWDTGTELHCYRLQLALKRNDRGMVTREGKPLWFSPKGRADACAPVFDALFTQGQLDNDDVWARIRLALQANNPDFALQLAPRLSNPAGLDAKLLRLLASKPAKAYPKLNASSRGGREIVLFAIDRAARAKSDEGLALLNKWSARLPDADRQQAWRRLAFHASRRHDARALDWWHRGGNPAQFDQDSREWYVRAALRAGDWKAVANGIDAMETRPLDAAWRYWRARAAVQAGQTGDANKRFAELAGEHHFYGLLAREALGSIADTTIGRYKPSSEELQAIRQMAGVERALALHAMDWRSEGVREWNWAMRGLSDRQLLAAAEVARQYHWYDRAIYSAERTRDIHDFGLRFLAPYRDITQAYSRQLGLDEAWVFGLIRQESRFVNVARSSVGAQGLMQVMPATARWVARKMGVGYSPEAANEIGTNVQLGTWYLKHVLDGLGNQPVLATAAYNAGPGRARNWRGEQALEGAIYAETIPFAETRDYVKKVMSNAVYYAQAFGRGETSLTRRMGIVPGSGGQRVSEVDDPSPAVQPE